MEEDSSFFGLSRVRELFGQRLGNRCFQRKNTPVESDVWLIVLTFFLSTREVAWPLRDGLLGANRSKKLILTGWPFPLRRGAMLVEIWTNGCSWVMAEGPTVGGR